MPAFFQAAIRRADLRANPRQIYVFGDNVLRKGRGGLAREMRGEPNALGLPVKWCPGRHPDDYFSDGDWDACFEHLLKGMQQIDHVLSAGGTAIFPKAPIGSGLAELPQRAPRLYGALVYGVMLLIEQYGLEPCPWLSTGPAPASRPGAPSMSA